MTRLLPLVALLLAACAPPDHAPVGSKRPQVADRFVEGKTYIAWRMLRAGAEVSAGTFCRADHPVSETCGPTAAGGLAVGGDGRGFPARLVLPDGGAIDLLEVSVAGRWFPARVFRTAKGLAAPDSLPVFTIEPGQVNYLGSYDATLITFETGTWDPDRFKIGLAQIGRSDLAQAVVATPPGTVRLNCDAQSCAAQDSAAPYPGLTLVR